jgi:rare lipoprotein A
MKNKKSTAQTYSPLPALLVLCIVVAGCSHRRVQAPAPPPPPPQSEYEQPAPPPPAEETPQRRDRVLSSEIGLASWYGAPYHNARVANGQIYNQNAMTAAHRTLPLGTVVRVTNLATDQSAVVTITDRGPFVRGRVLDLSRAAAIKTGVWRSGIARVRIDVLRDPPSVSPGGRWCVQIGAFQHEGSAEKLRDRLKHQYSRANVIDFKGATGYWVRIRPEGQSRRAALDVASTMRLSDADAYAYVVRLD